jgi:hypothetical protein
VARGVLPDLARPDGLVTKDNEGGDEAVLPRYSLSSFQRYTGSSIREFNMADVEPIAIWIKHLIRSFEDSDQEL